MHEQGSKMLINQIDPSVRLGKAAREALRTIPRGPFLPQQHRALAYAERDIIDGEDLYFLRPLYQARLLAALDIKPHDYVLVVARDRGYSAALCAQQAETIIILEPDPEKAAVITHNLHDLHIENWVILQAPFEEGAACHAPFGKILLTLPVRQLPEIFLRQLGPAGHMVCIRQADDGPGMGLRLSRNESGHLHEETMFFCYPGAVFPAFAKRQAFVFP